MISDRQDEENAEALRAPRCAERAKSGAIGERDAIVSQRNDARQDAGFEILRRAQDDHLGLNLVKRRGAAQRERRGS